MQRPLAAAAALVAVIGAGYGVGSLRRDPPPGTQATRPPDAPEGAPMVEVRTVALSVEEGLGKTAFDARCASCHGENAAGRNGMGPPLVHVIYEPGHHGDQAFLLAVRNGVRAHHWRFGDMAPVEGLTAADVAGIVAYVRALQRANGIE